MDSAWWGKVQTPTEDEIARLWRPIAARWIDEDTESLAALVRDTLPSVLALAAPRIVAETLREAAHLIERPAGELSYGTWAEYQYVAEQLRKWATEAEQRAKGETNG